MTSLRRTACDFDFMIDTVNGMASVTECYPDAFTTIFKGKSCTIYEVPEDGNLVLHRYEDTSAFKQKISTHIVDRLIRFDALQSIQDGHLL